jgi:hypothetical protein
LLDSLFPVVMRAGFLNRFPALSIIGLMKLDP